MRRKKLLIIKPSKNTAVRRTKRYVVVDVVSKTPIDTSTLETNVRLAVTSLFGQVWLDISNPRVIYFVNSKAIISTNRVGYRVVLASLPKVAEVSNDKVIVVPRKITGSVKKAKRLVGIG
ncbi:MAG: ribonuclease P [Sulfolobales archaeon]|nr:ribonuclease P [Sulfolobales archaeon]